MNKIVRLQFHDADINERNGILKTYYLVNPDRKKLGELKAMVENRFEYGGDDCDYTYWDKIDDFVQRHFTTVEVADTFVVEY